jgi:predicted DNA-binding protein YlxM (UPF0122 family)
MPEEAVRMAMLYDFFGQSLTKTQRLFFDLYYNENLSLGEIAENHGVTRQSVHDTLGRAQDALLRLENSTGALRRFESLRSGLTQARALAERLADMLPEDGQSAGGEDDAAQVAVRLLSVIDDMRVNV